MTLKKKLIEIPEPAFKILQRIAEKQNTKLKPFIEKLLVEYAENSKR